MRPRITGIRERVEPRLSRRSVPLLSAGADTKPGRKRDVVPGAPPNPVRRAPSRDTRDSTVKIKSDHRAGDPGEKEERGAAGGCRGRGDGGMEGTHGEDGHIYARGVLRCDLSLSSSPSLSSSLTFLSKQSPTPHHHRFSRM